MKEKMIERLKQTMEKNEITAAELARRTGIRASSISDWLRGKYEPKQDKVDILARALNVKAAWLLGYDEPALPSGAFRPHTKSVRMMGYAAAGKPLEDLNQDQRYVDIEGDYDVDFCITVKGDSMIGADINDGDIVFIKSMPEVENGQIACVEIDNERVCLKRFYKNGNQIILNSENPKYMPMTFNEENCESIRVLGLAVIKQSEIR